MASNNGTTTARVINPNYTGLGDGAYGRTDLLGSTHSEQLSKRARIDGKPPVGRDDSVLQGAVADLLGPAVVTPVLSRNLDMVQGYPRSTTGIPYAIQGTAKVLNVNVSEYLAAFKDPIKTILGTSIHREAKVIITRKYVVGGRALITPEHAPARTVAIAEDAREVTMTRYGGDIEMNLNLFLRPEDAREELDMKINAQRRELERVLVEGAYSMLMEEGTNIVDAIIRSNPAYSTATNSSMQNIRDAAERINMSTVFGAMSKHNFPVQSLMAAARYASAYSTSTQKGSVLLLPHGSMDLLRHTRRENLVYNISGPELLSRNKGKPISMEYEDAFTDPSTSVRIVIHRPFPTFQAGVASPDVGLGGLSDIVTFASYYVLPALAAKPGDDPNLVGIVDFENRCWHNLGSVDTLVGARPTVLTPINDDVPDWAKSWAALPSGWPGTDKNREYVLELCAAEVKTSTAILEEFFTKAKDGECTKEEVEALVGKTAVPNLVYMSAFEAAAELMDAAAWEDMDNGKYAAFTAGVLAKVNAEVSAHAPVLVRPQMEAVMSSGILAVPGADTGELLIGYPFTSVSTSSTEIVKIQLRVYLGSVLKKPENVLLLRNICFEGLKSGAGTTVAPGHTFGPAAGDLAVVHFPTKYLDSHCKIDYADFDVQAIMGSTASPTDKLDMLRTTVQLADSLGIFTPALRLDAQLFTEGYPTVLYKGTVRHKLSGGTWEVVETNNGHLGVLDDPKMADRIFGTFAYNAEPNPDPR